MPCCHSVTRTILEGLVSSSDRQKHDEVVENRKNLQLLKFCCPKCSEMCQNYRFDSEAVDLFRKNFTGSRYTYILVDKTSSMVSFSAKKDGSRIVQTKTAIKQLLKEIARFSGPHDLAILTMFDEELIKPDFIPECHARDIATASNLNRVDTFEMSSSFIGTNLFSAMHEIYAMLDERPFQYIDVYIYSDGLDTSSRKNDKTYQALVRGLNERVGAKCHFVSGALVSGGFSLGAWLGDPDADCPIAGIADEIQAQVTSYYRKQHPVLQKQHCVLRENQHSEETYLTNAERASLRKPKKEQSTTRENVILTSSQTSQNNGTHIESEPLKNLVVPGQALGATSSKSDEPQISGLVTRNIRSRKNYK